MNCRSCEGSTHPVFSLGDMPLANSLLDSPDQFYKTYPLDLMQCESCSLVQLSEIVPPEEMFVDYSYLTCCSPPMVEHARELVNKVLTTRDLTDRSLVVEIGSNDGYLLQHYKSIPVMGIDPSDHAAEAAIARGVPTIRSFFGLKLAIEMSVQADVIHANNVLAHVPDLNDFVAGLAMLLKRDGVLIVEVPYLYDLLDKTAFDTLYHEHVYYFSISSIYALFARHGLFPINVERISTHGGSLRLWFGKGKSCEVSVQPEPIREGGYWMDFSYRVEKCRRDTREMLSGRTVAGFGAAAKATIFLNACGITRSIMPYVVDDTPTKQGKFIPSTGIPVIPVVDWLADRPNATMILAWNFAHEIAYKYTPTYKGQFFTWYSRMGVLA